MNYDNDRLVITTTQAGVSQVRDAEPGEQAATARALEIMHRRCGRCRKEIDRARFIAVTGSVRGAQVYHYPDCVGM